MTRRIFEFKCKCGHMFDELIDDKLFETPCPICEDNAMRIISPVRIDWLKMGVSSAYPSCADKWARAHEQAAKEKSPDCDE